MGSSVNSSRGKHRVGYDPAWKKEWPWLLYKEGEGVFCTLCIKHNASSRSKTGVWVSKPCSSVRKDKVKKHARSDTHRSSEQLEAMSVTASGDGGIVQAFEHVLALKKKAVEGGMKILYWLCKNEVAHFSKFESLKQLCIDLGCTYLKELNVAGNANYSSHRIISEWLDVMSQQIGDDVLERVRGSPAIGLMVDESTDISTTKELSLYARALFNGEVKVYFLKLVKIPNGTADEIENAIVTYLQEAKVGISKISSFGSDGAAVMTGGVNGVSTRLKRLNPHMISIHCINHHLALGVSQAAKSVSYLNKFAEILVSIYKFYHHSAVRQAGLEEIQTILNDPHVHFKIPSATRWLSHAQAVDAIGRSLFSLLVSLDKEASEKKNPTAIGLLALCKTYEFIATLMLMSDILSHVNKLSLIFQMETIDFSNVNSLVESCIIAMKKLKANPGPAMKSTSSVIQQLQKEHDMHISNVTEVNREKFKKEVQDQFCDELIEHLNKRFPDLPMVKAFEVFDPQKNSSEDACGCDFITQLCDHYGVDDCTTQQEWDSLRNLLQKPDFKEKSATQVMKSLSSNETLIVSYPIMSKFAQIALTLPVSNADVERGFSCMNRVKTELRNRLTVSTSHFNRRT